jgi:hypothetical protein
MDYINATNGIEISSRETSVITDRPELTVTYSGPQGSSARTGNLSESLEELEMLTLSESENISLFSNYPNPFRLTTTIEFELNIDSWVQMTIYDIRGQIVRNLKDELMTAGQNAIVWNGKDDMGNTVKSGIYFIQLSSENTRLVRKMILQK